MNLVDYEKYYHSGSEFIIPRDEFEKIIEENQRLKEEYIMLQNASEEYEDKLLKENQRLQLALKNSKLSHKNIVRKSQNQKEEIKRLYKQREKLWKRKAFLGKENQRLNNDIKILLKENEAKEKVIIKYDNVLNELEKWLKNFKELYEGNEFQNNAKFCITVDNVLNKLNELKKGI